MHVIGLIAGNLLLALIFLQDIKYRAVSWILFPAVVLVLMAGAFFGEIHFQTWFSSIAMNWGFLILNMAFLMGWFSIKGVSAKAVLQKFLGLGDLLFFVVMAFSLPFPAFPIIFVASLLLALMAGLVLLKGPPFHLRGYRRLYWPAAYSLIFLS